MPSRPIDAMENLPKEAPRQVTLGEVTLGEVEDEASGMPDETSARLEQPLLETREGPDLDGDGQHQPSQRIAEVVGDDPEQQADLVRAEAVAREARPMGGFLAFLDPLLRALAL